jgi:hypothetical protein
LDRSSKERASVRSLSGRLGPEPATGFACASAESQPCPAGSASGQAKRDGRG